METDTYTYDAWGNLIGRTGSTLNARLYAGEELDPDLGLINLRARQYRPGTGRFLTTDPMMGGPELLFDPESAVALNSYLYTSGDPINGLDPAGLTTLAEYSIQIKTRVYSIALHSGPMRGRFLG